MCYYQLVSNWILTILVLISLIQTALVVVFLCKVRAVFREFVTFLTPVSETEPSPVASIWEAMAKTLTQQFKMTLMGMLSVQSKAEKRIESDLVMEEVATKSPVYALIFQALPGLKKMARRNPALVEAIANKLASIGGKQALSTGNGAEPGDFGKRLSMYG